MNLQFIGGLVSLALLLAGGGTPQEPVPQPPAPPAGIEEGTGLPCLSLHVGEHTFSAQLEDSDTARALLERLPLSLPMEELHGNEKYGYLESPLPTHPFLPGSIRAGDLLLYGEDCLVVFYEGLPDSPYSYTALGHIENPEGLAGALGNGSVTVRFTVQ